MDSRRKTASIAQEEVEKKGRKRRRKRWKRNDCPVLVAWEALCTRKIEGREGKWRPAGGGAEKGSIHSQEEEGGWVCSSIHRGGGGGGTCPSHGRRRAHGRADVFPTGNAGRQRKRARSPEAHQRTLTRPHGAAARAWRGRRRPRRRCRRRPAGGRRRQRPGCTPQPAGGCGRR
jgi:hypothetical protein